MTHNYGVFRLEPGLTWGYQPINNNIQGAYYRFAYQDLRWQVDGGIDTGLEGGVMLGAQAEAEALDSGHVNKRI